MKIENPKRDIRQAIETLKKMEEEICYGEFNGYARKLSLNMAIEALKSNFEVLELNERRTPSHEQEEGV